MANRWGNNGNSDMRESNLPKVTQVASCGTKIGSPQPGSCGNINNLRITDDTTLMAQSEEKLKSLLMKVKEESEKVGLKLNSKN